MWKNCFGIHLGYCEYFHTHHIFSMIQSEFVFASATVMRIFADADLKHNKAVNKRKPHNYSLLQVHTGIKILPIFLVLYKLSVRFLLLMHLLA